ncbi:MAG: hypothetical protein HFJ35_08015 [Clostridia bacterium]|nr:hypothetical protein [Clostridia bacterium]
MIEDEIKKEREKLEKDELVKKMLKYKIEQGLSYHAISKKPDIAIKRSATIKEKIQKCVDFGIVTQEEIAEAELEKEKRDLIEDEQVQRILNYRKQGLSYDTISEMPDVTLSRAGICKKVKKCIDLGIVTNEELEVKNFNIIKYREQGMDYKEIAEMSDILLDEHTVRNRILKFIELGLTTEAKYKEGKRERERKALLENEQVLKILEYKKQRISDHAVSEMPDVTMSYNRIQKTVKKCIDLGIVTKEEIEEKQKEEKNLKIIKYREQGMNYREIAEKPDILLDEKTVKNRILKLIELGLTTEDKYKEGKKERERKALLENEQVLKIIKYREQRIPYKKISEMPDISVSRDTVKRYIQRAIELGIVKESDTEKSEQQPSKEEQKEGIEKEENIMRLNQLKRQIEISVRLKNLPADASDEEKQKIREYIDLWYKIYEKEKMTKEELLFLKLALQKIPIDENDIIRFAKQSIVIGEYTEALNFIRNRHGKQEISISEEKEQALEKLEGSLIKASKVESAIQIIKRGNTNTEILSSIVGLSKEEINILKIQLSGKPIKLLNMSRREKVVELLLQDKKANLIQRKLGMSDLEMQDIEDEVRYKRLGLNEATPEEVKVKQNTRIRIVILATKLGMKIERIAKVLKIEPEEVEKDIEEALKVDLIKINEVHGIKMLNSQDFKFKELEL